MATIRSYTTIEQSRKLAEFLPLESADMQWFLEEDYGIVQIKEGLQDWGGDCTVPCWSLASLIDVLPLPDLIQDKVDDELFWQCSVYDKDGKLLCEAYDSNLIDACYEMILKLHELKML